MAVLNTQTSGRKTPAPSPRQTAMKRILASYRRKILTIFPSAKFTDEYMLGCTVEQWADQIEKSFGEGMTWENYGAEWVVINRTPRKEVDMADPSQFYNYFRAGQFVATPNRELPAWLRNLRSVKAPAPVGFTGPGVPAEFAFPPAGFTPKRTQDRQGLNPEYEES